MGAAGHVTIAPLADVSLAFLKATGRSLFNFWPYLADGKSSMEIGGERHIVVYEDDQGYKEWDDPIHFNIYMDKYPGRKQYSLDTYEVPELAHLRNIIESLGQTTEVWT